MEQEELYDHDPYGSKKGKRNKKLPRQTIKNIVVRKLCEDFHHNPYTEALVDQKYAVEFSCAVRDAIAAADEDRIRDLNEWAKTSRTLDMDNK